MSDGFRHAYTTGLKKQGKYTHTEIETHTGFIIVMMMMMMMMMMMIFYAVLFVFFNYHDDASEAAGDDERFHSTPSSSAPCSPHSGSPPEALTQNR